ncbi:MAG: carbon-nitrogen hydrolase family protein [Chloroflexi bacterium]|jgi:N-carbamoylputrescine amidase|nr:carbon-nitrogen hydrolase family protein [Chloroflexota bacterium]
MTTQNTSVKIVRVAAVQMRSELAAIDKNLHRAGQLAAEAAGQGAQLIVLPELAASGYSLSRKLWDAAEQRGGQTQQWLQETAQRLGVYLGIGLIEAQGEDFYDAYLLAAPDGQLAGRIYKTMAEVNVFRRATNDHTVETALGKIGLGVCADNHFVPMVRLMQQQAVDLMLMPHAWPAPFKTGRAVSQEDIRLAHEKAHQMAPLYTRLLGVPAVFANQVGPRSPEPWDGITGSLMTAELFHMGGCSTIADGDGTVLAQLDDHTEGVIVAGVSLDAGRKNFAAPAGYGHFGGGWIHAGTPMRDAMCDLDSFIGRTTYRWSRERRARARARAQAAPGEA